jgi:hypothetical protein
MANTRIGDPIPKESSLPYGEDKCIILEGYVADGTAVDAEAVIPDTTDPEKLIRAGDNVEALGVLLFNPKAGVVKGTAMTAGTKVRVLISGPVCWRLTISADNVLAGNSLSLAPGSGLGGPGADGKWNYATLIDKRAKNASTNDEHIVNWHGCQRNDT